MTLGEIPRFLNGTPIFLAPQRLREGILLAKAEETALRFRIVKSDGYVLNGRAFEHRFLTQAEGHWRVEFHPSIHPVQGTVRPHEFEEVVQGLASRQDFGLLLRTAEVHERNVYFLAANWDRLAEILSPNGHGKNGYSPVGFTEVHLGNGYGHADFVGVIPGVAVFLIEVGQGGKPEAIRRYTEGLRTGLNLQGSAVIPLIVNYYGRNRLYIHP